MYDADVSRRTELSPRFVADTLVYYEGDVFSVVFTFALTDNNGNDVKIGPGDRIRFIFHRNMRIPETVAVEIQGEDVTDNAAVLHFTPEITEKFRRGQYTYRIQYLYGNAAVTVVANGKMIVE